MFEQLKPMICNQAINGNNRANITITVLSITFKYAGEKESRQTFSGLCPKADLTDLVEFSKMSIWKQKKNSCDWLLEEAQKIKIRTTLNKNDPQIWATARWILGMTTGWKDLHKITFTRNCIEKPLQLKQHWISLLIPFAKGHCCCKFNHTVIFQCIINFVTKEWTMNLIMLLTGKV